MSLYRLKRIADTAEPELRVWLLDAIERYKRDGGGLESALAVKGTRAMIRRNEVLLQAGDLLDPEGKLEPWARAGLLADAIECFESAGGTGNNELDHLIAESLDSGKPLRSQRWIHELMK